MPPRPGRRQFLTTGALGLFALGAAGCSSPEAGRGQAAPGQGDAWSFTDDAERTVRLGRRPQRIVAYATAAAALWDYGIRPVGVYGALRKQGGGKDVTVLGEVDLSRVATVGTTWGHISVERLGRLHPDLVVDPLQYGAPQIDPSSLKLTEKLAPVVSIEVYGAKVDTTVRRYADLAAAFGAGFTAQELRRGKAAYTAARDRVRRAITGKPGLRVLFASADQDGIRISKAGFPSIADFESLGLNVVKPTGGSTIYVEKLSWELVDRYPADLILLDVRSSSLQPADLSSNGLWRSLPAVRAGQLGPWNPEPNLSHHGMAKVYDSLTTTLTGARPHIT
ncbi:ABC transporter substrate-binding protein [Streptantibioticus ferralitis]|uniref:ABC transporter substrate-binding protein n=1 Tax=Streptantibioticus ferralitis TaxID=236510 RepID=A0ABT5ZE20_9ACTN|nr:ABC transporter substrate-binding protein [Streptantibioticus ferralitis]MDF2261285.1 ABC transporter substrate-binding protein [Streptantibioticus ferralitis]